jgi:hypothetical protein
MRWFKRWFRTMPTEWQEGFVNAENGGAFSGEFLTREGKPGCIVFFVHPSLRGRIEHALQSGFSTGLPLQGPI